MSVDPAAAEEHVQHLSTTQYYFCSAGCKETFDKDPGNYIAGSKTKPTG